MKFYLFMLFLQFTELSSIAQEKIPINIRGEIIGFEEGTWCYIYSSTDPIRPVMMDSVKVNNNRIEFYGYLSDSVQKVYFEILDLKSKVIYVDGGGVSVTLAKSKYEISVTHDSQVQRKLNRLDSCIQVQEDHRKKLSLLAVKRGTSDSEKLEISKELFETRNHKVETIAQFIESNSNSVFGALLLCDYYKLLGRKSTLDIYSNFTSDVKKSHSAQFLQTNILLTDGKLNVGDNVIDFRMIDLNFDTITLSKLSFKFLLIEFWASSCGPCRVENPAIVEIYTAHKKHGFEILGVSLDTKREKWINAIRKDRLNWLNVCDFMGTKSPVIVSYGILGMPMNYLVNSNGVIIGKNLNPEQLKYQLEYLFAH